MFLRGLIGGVWVCPGCSKIQRRVSKASDLYDAMINVMHSCPPVPVHELLLPERHPFLPHEQRWRSELRGFPRPPSPGKPKHTVFLRGRFPRDLRPRSYHFQTIFRPFPQTISSERFLRPFSDYFQPFSDHFETIFCVLDLFFPCAPPLRAWTDQPPTSKIPLRGRVCFST